MTRSDQWTARLLGGLYALVAVGLPLVRRDAVSGLRLLELAALVVLYAVAFRTEFESPVGSAVPTEPVLVAMLFLLPLQLVPLTVLVAQTIRRPGSGRRRHLHEVFVEAIAGAHCLGPVLVLALLGDPVPRLDRWWVYVLAFAAQYVFDGTTAVIRAVALGTPLRQLVAPLSWTFLIDALLAPVGLAAVLATDASAATVVFIAAPVVLVRVLSKDRRVKVEEAQSLGEEIAAARVEARIDPMTGLANRLAWHEAVSRAAAAFDADRSGTRVTIVFTDLDHLKRANDTHGHAVGDALICAMATCIQATAPSGALVARLGGDEFGLLIVDPAGRDRDAELADRLAAEIATHPLVHGLELSASIGVASCPPADHPGVALRLADQRTAADKLARRVGRPRTPPTVDRQTSPASEIPHLQRPTRQTQGAPR